MHLHRLQLTNFRCYRELDFSPHPGRTVVVGDNAQGKSSLLESFVVAATTRAAHGAPDRDLVRRPGGEGEPSDHARVWAEIDNADGRTQVEVILLPQTPADHMGELGEWDASPAVSKRVRVNGAPRRAVDAVGIARSVLFAPQDLALVDGPPSVRRRYLDVLLCQTDRAYCRALTTFTKVLTQRNHLLRQLSGHRRSAGPDELDYWDEALAESGGQVLAARWVASRRLALEAGAVHDELTGQGPRLRVEYRSSVRRPWGSAWAEGERFVPSDNEPSWPDNETLDAREHEPANPLAARSKVKPGQSNEQDRLASEMADALRDTLRERRSEEIARGVTVAGPHRDDLAFAVGDTDLRRFGSRGQQRSAAIALKLAEALLLSNGADAPAILLDDVLSELDASRRDFLAEKVLGASQVLLTTTDLDQVPIAYRRGAQIVTVRRADVASLTLEGVA